MTGLQWGMTHWLVPSVLAAVSWADLEGYGFTVGYDPLAGAAAGRISPASWHLGRF